MLNAAAYLNLVTSFGTVLCLSRINDLEMEWKTTKRMKHCHLAIKKSTHLHKIYFESRCTCAIHYCHSSPSFCFDLHSIYTHTLISVLNEVDKTHSHWHDRPSVRPINRKSIKLEIKIVELQLMTISENEFSESNHISLLVAACWRRNKDVI